MGEKEWSKRFKGGGGVERLEGEFWYISLSFPYMLVGIVGVWVKFKLESVIKKVAKLYSGSLKVNYVIKYIKA